VNPKISVIIPVYNPGLYLRRCLDSVLGQTYENIEVILVDDGSTDGSDRICDEYAQKDERIVCIHQRNAGVSAARNRGLELCTGEYVHMPDSDDYIERDSYELLLNQMQRLNVDCVAFEYFVNYTDKEIVHQNKPNQYGIYSGIESQEKLFAGFQFACTKFIKKTMLEGLSFREDIRRGEDTLFAASALMRCAKVLFIATPLYHYVQTSDSACRGKFRRSQLSVTKLYDAYAELYTGYNRSLYNKLVRYLHDNIIMIYYDMWIDAEDWKSDMRSMAKLARNHYWQAMEGANFALSKVLKFSLFHLSPNIYCLIHQKLAH